MMLPFWQLSEISKSQNTPSERICPYLLHLTLKVCHRLLVGIIRRIVLLRPFQIQQGLIVGLFTAVQETTVEIDPGPLFSSGGQSQGARKRIERCPVPVGK